MSERFEHDCPDCIYQGIVGMYDVYYCPGPFYGGPTMVYRYASDEEGNYGQYLARGLRTKREVV